MVLSGRVLVEVGGADAAGVTVGEVHFRRVLVTTEVGGEGTEGVTVEDVPSGRMLVSVGAVDIVDSDEVIIGRGVELMREGVLSGMVVEEKLVTAG